MKKTYSKRRAKVSNLSIENEICVAFVHIFICLFSRPSFYFLISLFCQMYHSQIVLAISPTLYSVPYRFEIASAVLLPIFNCEKMIKFCFQLIINSILNSNKSFFQQSISNFLPSHHDSVLDQLYDPEKRNISVDKPQHMNCLMLIPISTPNTAFQFHLQMETRAVDRTYGTKYKD